MDIKREMVKIANDIADITASEGWMTVAQVREICASCADKMEAKGMTKIKKAALINAAQTWQECINQAKKNPDVKDPEKLCGWLKSHGPNAPAGEKKGPFKASEKTAGAWDKLPRGWTKESVTKFWKSLTGDKKHKITACMKKMEGTGITDTGAFCASLSREIDRQ